MVNSALRYVAVLCLILSVSLMLAGCSGDDKKAEQAAQQGPVPMKVVKAEARDMPQWGEFVGQISAHETVEVRARVAGFLVERKFEEGRHVNKDDLLFVIDPKPFQEDLKQAQSGLEYNQALYEKAQKDFERFKKLYDEGVVSRDEYEGYQTQVATYKAQISDNRAQVQNAKIQLGYTKIYSPINGTIGRVQVDVGNLVGQGENTLLATISTQDPVYVSFSVSEGDYIRAMRDVKATAVRTERPIRLVLADGGEYRPARQASTWSIRPSIPRPAPWASGCSSRIRTTCSSPASTPRSGCFVSNHQGRHRGCPGQGRSWTSQGMKSVYLVDADGTIKNQPVKLGTESRENWPMVTEGVKAGDMLLVPMAHQPGQAGHEDQAGGGAQWSHGSQSQQPAPSEGEGTSATRRFPATGRRTAVPRAGRSSPCLSASSSTGPSSPR